MGARAHGRCGPRGCVAPGRGLRRRGGVRAGRASCSVADRPSPSCSPASAPTPPTRVSRRQRQRQRQRQTGNEQRQRQRQRRAVRRAPCAVRRALGAGRWARAWCPVWGVGVGVGCGLWACEVTVRIARGRRGAAVTASAGRGILRGRPSRRHSLADSSAAAELSAGRAPVPTRTPQERCLSAEEPWCPDCFPAPGARVRALPCMRPAPAAVARCLRRRPCGCRSQLRPRRPRRRRRPRQRRRPGCRCRSSLCAAAPPVEPRAVARRQALRGAEDDGDHTVLVTREVDGQQARSMLTTDNREFSFRWIRWANDDRPAVRRVPVAATSSRPPRPACCRSRPMAPAWSAWCGRCRPPATRGPTSRSRSGPRGRLAAHGRHVRSRSPNRAACRACTRSTSRPGRWAAPTAITRCRGCWRRCASASETEHDHHPRERAGQPPAAYWQGLSRADEAVGRSASTRPAGVLRRRRTKGTWRSSPCASTTRSCPRCARGRDVDDVILAEDGPGDRAVDGCRWRRRGRRRRQRRPACGTPRGSYSEGDRRGAAELREPAGRHQPRRTALPAGREQQRAAWRVLLRRALASSSRWARSTRTWSRQRRSAAKRPRRSARDIRLAATAARRSAPRRRRAGAAAGAAAARRAGVARRRRLRWSRTLASRGWRSRAVNCRSDGFGVRFHRRPPALGLRMQDDLTDAVQWADPASSRRRSYRRRQLAGTWWS